MNKNQSDKMEIQGKKTLKIWGFWFDEWHFKAVVLKIILSVKLWTGFLKNVSFTEVQFMYNKLHPFKVYNFLSFDRYIHPWNHKQNQDTDTSSPKFFLHYKLNFKKDKSWSLPHSSHQNIFQINI